MKANEYLWMKDDRDKKFELVGTYYKTLRSQGGGGFRIF